MGLGQMSTLTGVGEELSPTLEEDQEDRGIQDLSGGGTPSCGGADRRPGGGSGARGSGRVAPSRAGTSAGPEPLLVDERGGLLRWNPRLVKTM